MLTTLLHIMQLPCCNDKLKLRSLKTFTINHKGHEVKHQQKAAP